MNKKKLKSEKKNIVCGLGEIGTPILKLLSKKHLTIGYDIDSKLMNLQKFKKFQDTKTSFLHICIPFTKNFQKNVQSLYQKFYPDYIVIHSTISPSTTNSLQNVLPIPVIYSATRGVHRRMLSDLSRYTKFYAIDPKIKNAKSASLEYAKLLKTCGVKTKKMSNPLTLELAKIVVDTSYYGWLINYAQISNVIAKKHGVDYDEMWTFSDEIHKFLGNRPKLFPGFIGGHCVIPNLKLIDEKSLWEIDQINNYYLRKIKNAKSISKKYTKGKQSYDST